MQQQFAGKKHLILAFLVIMLMGQVVAGDQIYVNQTGWWREGENFTPSFWPIEHAILNVSTSGSTVTIVEPGDYPHAITFWSSVQDGITLDLNGSTLNGTAFGVPAILIEGKNDITIRGGTIYRYTNGIVTTGTYDNLRLENLTISQSSEPAIRMDGAATNVTIDRVTITQSGIYGIEKNAGTVRNLTVTNSLISQPAIGGPTLDAVRFEDMGSYSFRDIVIDNVTAVNMTDHGIRIQQISSQSRNVTILNSTVTGTGNHGFFIESRGTIRLENNTATDCGQNHSGGRGMYLVNPVPDSLITFTNDNRISGSRNGLHLQNFRDVTLQPGTTIRDNRGLPYQIIDCNNFTLMDTVIDNTGGAFSNGIVTTGTYDNLRLENLTISRSSEPAIRMDGAATNVTIDRVTITQSGIYGIEKNAGTVRNLTVTNSLISQPAIGGPTLDAVRFEDMGSYSFRDIVIDNVTAVNMTNYGIRVQQISSQSGNVTILNSTVTGTGNHGFFIESRGTIRLENNTATDCGQNHSGGRGMYLVNPVPDSLITFTNDNRISGSRNGLHLQNFRDVTLQPGTTIRDNRGLPYQIIDCNNFTLMDTVIDNAGGAFSNGIVTTGTYDNLRLENLTISQSSEPAIRMDGAATNVTIDRVTITQSGTYGIEKNAGTVRNLTVTNSLISQPAIGGPTLDAVRFEDMGSYSFRDIVIDNVTAVNMTDHGIRIQQISSQSVNVTILNSTVTGTGNHGFFIESRGTIRLENNTVADCGFTGSYGLFLAGIDNPEVTYLKNTVQGNKQGNYISGIEGNFNESRFQNLADDLNLAGSSHINTYNSTFDKTKGNIADTSLLNVFWFVDLTVLDEGFSPVEGAFVLVNNSAGSTVYSGTTDASGRVPRFALNEYTRNSTAEVFHTPFQFHAEKAGATNDTAINVDRTLMVPLILKQPLPAPVASFTANRTSGNTPLAVRFNDTSLNNPTEWNWSFGDGTWFNTTEFTSRNVTKVYDNPGTYTVRLTVSNEGGSDSTLTGTDITVTEPVPSFTVMTPNGGEHWIQSSLQTITWNYTYHPGSMVMIELLRGTTVDTVISSGTSVGTEGSGSFTWRIPYNQTLASD